MKPMIRGALRIGRAAGSGGPRDAAGSANADGDPNYYQKLTNLFPAEALALYGAGVALFGSSTLLIVAVVLAVLLALRTLATQPATGGSAQPIPVAVAAISFVLWATATDPHWLEGPWFTGWTGLTELEYLRKCAAFLGGAVAALAPLFVRSDH